MRSPFDLISTVAEAKSGGGVGNTAVSLGGGQGGAFGATLDGVSVNTNRQADITETAFLTPSLEAITEFSVETNGFKPEFGQAGGGGITFASKSGTNVLQGSGYGFFRHDALDKKGFFEQTKGIYKQRRLRGVARRAGPDPGHVQRKEPHVLLRVVRGLLQPGGQQRGLPQRADAGNVGRRLLELGRQPGAANHHLRSGDDARQPEWRRVHPRPVPEQPDSGRAIQHRGEAVHRAGQVGAGAEPAGARARAHSATSTTTSCPKTAARSRRRTSSASRSITRSAAGIAWPTCSTGRATRLERDRTAPTACRSRSTTVRKSTFDGDLHRVTLGLGRIAAS